MIRQLRASLCHSRVHFHDSFKLVQADPRYIKDIEDVQKVLPFFSKTQLDEGKKRIDIGYACIRNQRVLIWEAS